jgi:hypothetical protein
MVETGPDGRATVDFFMPVQADTGSLDRAHAWATAEPSSMWHGSSGVQWLTPGVLGGFHRTREFP